MSEKHNHLPALVPSGISSLQRVANSLRISNKLLAECKIESVIIGEQEWMLRNLDVSHFRNGEPIPEVQNHEEWERAGIEGRPAWCYYDNDPENGKVYGKLYNWHAVNDIRGLAPVGWSIAKVVDWKNISVAPDREDLKHIDYNGEMTIEVLRYFMSSIDIGGKLKTTGYIENNSGLWKYDNYGATNESGFSAVPGGMRSKKGKFKELSELSTWWLQDEFSVKKAWTHQLFTGLHNLLIRPHTKVRAGR